MRIIVGGSLAGAKLVFALSVVAWGVRVLRARNLIRQPVSTPAKVREEPLTKGFSRLSPLALRMLIRTNPFPHLLVDVRDAAAAAARPLPADMAGAVQLPEARVSAVLRPRKSSDTWTACFGEHSATPTVRTCVVFVCDEGHEAARAAATARSLGFTRCAVLQGGLVAYDATVPLQPATQYINRDAVALLMDLHANHSTEAPRRKPPVLIDLRRHDERSLYGSIPGAVHVPVDQWAEALDKEFEEWGEALWFPKPTPDDVVVLHARTAKRAAWAAQVAADAGLHCLVYRQGTHGWKLDATVQSYAHYEPGDPPPEPEQFEIEHIDTDSAEAELRSLGLFFWSEPNSAVRSTRDYA